MNIEYLNPLAESFITVLKQHCSAKSLFQSTWFLKDSYPEDQTFDIAILGVNEDRFKPEYEGCALAPNKVRKEFYALIKPRNDLKIIDLGNIQAGNSINDTHFALKQVLNPLLAQKTVVLIIGGSQDLMAAQYAAYQGNCQNMHVLLVDAKVDVHTHENNNEDNYLPRIIAHEPGYLFNITQAGYQSYYVEPETYDAFERMNFDMMRLGSLRGNMQEIEPFCRNANMLGFSMQAIRAADAPAQLKPSPNGFGGEEACQLCRYAGMSNDVMSAGFYDLNPNADINNITSALLAQMLWYFVEGFANRRNDYPVAESNDYITYRTNSKNLTHEVVFYKSKLSNRWWMEVPYPRELSAQEGKFLVPCSYKDYQTALNDELPDKWMKTFQKL
ncbi:MAG: formimidoylglutamase [Bacteroidota bacterium]|nr:formimidoylglutamase [Bacteroidota bacterium]